MDTLDVGEQEGGGLHGVTGEQELAGCDREETPGAFEERGSGPTASGGAVTDKQAGETAFGQVLIEIGEQVSETLIGPALIV
jgi:hypothetical protein